MPAHPSPLLQSPPVTTQISCSDLLLGSRPSTLRPVGCLNLEVSKTELNNLPPAPKPTLFSGALPPTQSSKLETGKASLTLFLNSSNQSVARHSSFYLLNLTTSFHPLCPSPNSDLAFSTSIKAITSLRLLHLHISSSNQRDHPKTEILLWYLPAQNASVALLARRKRQNLFNGHTLHFTIWSCLQHLWPPPFPAS